MERVNDLSGAYIGYKRGCRHAQAVISAPAHYQQALDVVVEYGECGSYMAHCGSSVCMNATSTGASSCSNVGTLICTVHVSIESPSMIPLPITANDVSEWRNL